jgi:hypothetical protein
MLSTLANSTRRVMGVLVMVLHDDEGDGKYHARHFRRLGIVFKRQSIITPTVNFPRDTVLLIGRD